MYVQPNQSSHWGGYKVTTRETFCIACRLSDWFRPGMIVYLASASTVTKGEKGVTWRLAWVQCVVMVTKADSTKQRGYGSGWSDFVAVCRGPF